MRLVLAALFIGLLTTLIFDLWGLLLARLRGLPAPSWKLGGRWFGHCARGNFLHRDIAASPALPGETALGWFGHYLVGVLYAAFLLALAGPGWLAAPRLGPALWIGIVTVLAGWLLMSPGMGNGIAAARSPAPWTTRGLQLLAHVVFGLGLWISGWAWLALFG